MEGMAELAVKTTDVTVARSPARVRVERMSEAKALLIETIESLANKQPHMSSHEDTRRLCVAIGSLGAALDKVSLALHALQ